MNTHDLTTDWDLCQVKVSVCLMGQQDYTNMPVGWSGASFCSCLSMLHIRDLFSIKKNKTI